MQGSSDIVKISSVPETLDLLRSIDTDLVRIKPQKFLYSNHPLYFIAVNFDCKWRMMLFQAIVSIMGPYRTGKSFLLDQLTPHNEGVFPFKVNQFRTFCSKTFYLF